ncbi:MAG: hypothetical protein LBL13_01010 [Bacteroidales bacterium]|jgi:hypothetical protein|nr:hypothetical protein [Bacteroidales bacterium]
MNKIILCILTGMLVFTACGKICRSVKPPKDLKPIDWTHYNDVYTVSGNFYTLCSDIKSEYKDKEIMVYGWIWDSPYEDKIIEIIKNKFYFCLIENPDKINETPRLQNSIAVSVVRVSPIEKEQIQMKLDTCDLTRKCFVKGQLFFNCLHTMGCSEAVPEIFITNADDIYFE